MNKIIKAEQVNMTCSKQDDCPLVCGQCGREQHDIARTPGLIPHVCPVCTGSGIVGRGFYDRTSEMYTSCGGTETCRGCGGRGIVWG